MAETELRAEIDEMAGELKEITGEIRGRLTVVNVMASALIGLACLKVLLKIIKLPLLIIWRYKFVIGAAGLFGYLRLRKAQIQTF